MSFDARGGDPGPEQKEAENRVLVEKAKDLAERLSAALEKTGGKYTHTVSENESERELDAASDAVQSFWGEECGHINKTEAGPGGIWTISEIKRISDDIWLLHQVTPDDDGDVEEFEYHFLDNAQARERLEYTVEERRKEIDALEARKQEAMDVLDSIK